MHLVNELKIIYKAMAVGMGHLHYDREEKPLEMCQKPPEMFPFFQGLE